MLGESLLESYWCSFWLFPLVWKLLGNYLVELEIYLEITRLEVTWKLRNLGMEKCGVY